MYFLRQLHGIVLEQSVISPAFSYLTTVWSLSSTSSKFSSSASSSNMSSLYLGSPSLLSLWTWLCPIQTLLENRQLLGGTDGATDRAPSLERSDRTCRGRAMLTQRVPVCSLYSILRYNTSGRLSSPNRPYYNPLVMFDRLRNLISPFLRRCFTSKNQN